MTAIPWAEGADQDLSSVLDDYKWLRQALRALRFPRHPAEVLSIAEQRLRAAEERLARLGRRRELPELKPIIDLQVRCDAERDAVLDATIAAAERLDIPASGDVEQMLRAIYRSPARWPVRRAAPRQSAASLAWRVFASIAGVLNVLFGLLFMLAGPGAWMIFTPLLVSGSLLIASMFVRWKVFTGALGLLGTLGCWGIAIWFITCFRMC